MSKQDILDYVMHSPYNTNRSILESLLNSIESGGVTHSYTAEIWDDRPIFIIGDDEILNGDKLELTLGKDTIIGYYIEPCFIAESNGFMCNLEFDNDLEHGNFFWIENDQAFPPEGGFTPSGTINITNNGSVDVYDYAQANVNVDTFEPSGTTVISSPGTYNVYNYETAEVLLPTEYFNGTVTVSDGSATIHFSEYPTPFERFGEFNGLLTLNNVQYSFNVQYSQGHSYISYISGGLSIRSITTDEKLTGVVLDNISLSDGDYSCVVTDVPGIDYDSRPLTITSNGYYNVYGKSMVYINIQ